MDKLDKEDQELAAAVETYVTTLIVRGVPQDEAMNIAHKMVGSVWDK